MDDILTATAIFLMLNLINNTVLAVCILKNMDEIKSLLVDILEQYKKE